MTRIATVFGATGLQGGTVVRQLLKDGIFKPRAVTRDSHSDGARELAQLGAEVVEGDLSSYGSVKKAMVGAEVVFAVTFAPRGGKGNRENEQGKFIVDAARELGIKYLIWSSVTTIVGSSGGKYKALLLDDKAEVDGYLRASGVPHSILLTGAFLENWTRKELLDCATLNDNGDVCFNSRWVPGTLAVLSWIERDMALSVSALLRAYDNGRLSEISGKDYLMVCARLPIEGWHKIIETTLGKKVNVTWLPTVNFADLDNMYDSWKEFPWYMDKQVPDPGLVALGVEFGTLEDFVRTEMKPRLGL
ncbi:NmrA-domain-containing protein [Exidia glandulosa HHB12029]|uniref:NmrA-domain-containing protein n=1 Tax=Exidia glandulosa HHB12029 TaxID=1314781 RepID=A0A165FD05_EXIGL|nr:NmrA-domain-containing protein [Exidia glandulosa HHB12029]